MQLFWCAAFNPADRAVFINLRAGAHRCTSQPVQIFQWLDMPAASIVQPANIGSAANMRIQIRLAFQAGEMRIAPGFPFGLHGVQLGHMAFVQGGMQIAEMRLTINLVGFYARRHEIDCRHASVPGNICIFW